MQRFKAGPPIKEKRLNVPFIWVWSPLCLPFTNHPWPEILRGFSFTHILACSHIQSRDNTSPAAVGGSWVTEAMPAPRVHCGKRSCQESIASPPSLSPWIPVSPIHYHVLVQWSVCLTAEWHMLFMCCKDDYSWQLNTAICWAVSVSVKIRIDCKSALV